jgi:hypothetical protein
MIEVLEHPVLVVNSPPRRPPLELLKTKTAVHTAD